MVLVDDQRRYIDVNAAACLALGQSGAEFQQLRIDDLTPPSRWPAMEAGWARLMETGWIAGSSDVASPEQSYLGVTFCALSNVLPGRHLVAFAPAGWPNVETLTQLDQLGSQPGSALTPRELEVLQLAAEGRTSATIARELMVSGATVKTHFEHIYAKLGVRDRAAAVATAMRLGLIV
jgi:DNA-binding CsgD family transcriptional regulator